MTYVVYVDTCHMPILREMSLMQSNASSLSTACSHVPLLFNYISECMTHATVAPLIELAKRRAGVIPHICGSVKQSNQVYEIALPSQTR